MSVHAELNDRCLDQSYSGYSGTISLDLDQSGLVLGGTEHRGSKYTHKTRLQAFFKKEGMTTRIPERIWKGKKEKRNSAVRAIDTRLGVAGLDGDTKVPS